MSKIPYGYCHCGCGQKTTISKVNRKERGVVKGEPTRYISSHGRGTPETITNGVRFGRLTVVDFNGGRFTCRCDCGEVSIVRRENLVNGSTQSCGCLSREMFAARTHKHGNSCVGKITREFETWKNIKARCNNPNNKYYKNYGGRGITVCDRWVSSFKNFLEDMGKRPKGFTIERKNNDLGYSPENCVWATKKQQNRNKRNNKNITFQGKTQILVDWAAEIGINRNTITQRFKRGMSIENVLCK